MVLCSSLRELVYWCFVISLSGFEHLKSNVQHSAIGGLLMVRLFGMSQVSVATISNFGKPSQTVSIASQLLQSSMKRFSAVTAVSVKFARIIFLRSSWNVFLADLDWNIYCACGYQEHENVVPEVYLPNLSFFSSDSLSSYLKGCFHLNSCWRSVNYSFSL